MDAGLYIVGTPIGNLGDITLRAIETLKTANLIVAEDTRHTRHLLDRYEIRTPTMSCHKFNEASRVELILGKIRDGQSVLARFEKADRKEFLFRAEIACQASGRQGFAARILARHADAVNPYTPLLMTWES